MRKQNGLATLPEVLQAQEETARAAYELAGRAGRRARRPHGAAREASASVPVRRSRSPTSRSSRCRPTLEESVDQAIDRALMQRPDLIARLASRPRQGGRGAQGAGGLLAQVRRAVGGRRQHRGAEGRQQPVSRRRTSCSTMRASASSGRCSKGSSDATRCTSPSRSSTKRRTSWSTPRTRRCARCGRPTTTPRSPWPNNKRPRRCSPPPKAWEATLDSYRHGLATFPDVRESQRDLARARTLDQAARAEVWTQAAAFAFSTGDLARP